VLQQHIRDGGWLFGQAGQNGELALSASKIARPGRADG
jgi:hypothetical protein